MPDNRTADYILRLIRTARYLKPSQIGWRLVRRIRPVKPHEVDATRAVVYADWIEGPAPRAQYRGRDAIALLNCEVNLSDPDIWESPWLTRLQKYHLHYLDVVAKNDGEEKRGRDRALILRWIGENRDVGGTGWEPYPTSRRIVNIAKWLFGSSAGEPEIMRSLAKQASALEQQIEFDILANHLFANAKALLFAGYLVDCADSTRWRERGMRLIRREVAEQVLPDGGHFELSPMYHAIVLEDILDLLNLQALSTETWPVDLKTAAVDMILWLERMTHPDGAFPHFNDTGTGISATTEELKAYARQLGVPVKSSGHEWCGILEHSGYVRLASDDAVVFFDVGRVGPDYQPGHGHCDCLSVEMSAHGRRVLVNTGISTYDPGAKRFRERATAAHNTIEIPGREQSEIWGAFRVGERAVPTILSHSASSVHAEHNGFRSTGITHRRGLTLDGAALTIKDWLVAERSSNPNGFAFFHFHPDIEVTRWDEASVEFDGGRMEVEGAAGLDVLPYRFAHGIGRTEPAKLVRLGFKGELITRFRLGS